VSALRDLGGIVVDRGYQIGQQVRNLLFRQPHAERYPGGDRAPVVILPGVYETWQFLRLIADHLHQEGHPVHLLPELGYNNHAIPETAAMAQSYLDRHELTGVVLVAHSKGGLIGKHMMVTDDLSGRIASMVAINSPFGGSPLARWSPNRTLRAFSPKDATLTTLAANLEANSRITSIFSRTDPLIPGGSRLEGATNIELALVGHFRPLASREVLRILDSVLGHPAR
jgi:alpha-beta hydrolase superfamily lysophospholipase